MSRIIRQRIERLEAGTGIPCTDADLEAQVAEINRRWMAGERFPTETEAYFTRCGMVDRNGNRCPLQKSTIKLTEETS